MGEKEGLQQQLLVCNFSLVACPLISHPKKQDSIQQAEVMSNEKKI